MSRNVSGRRQRRQPNIVVVLKMRILNTATSDDTDMALAQKAVI
jgi:hypothetical protein